MADSSDTSLQGVLFAHSPSRYLAQSPWLTPILGSSYEMFPISSKFGMYKNSVFKGIPISSTAESLIPHIFPMFHQAVSTRSSAQLSNAAETLAEKNLCCDQATATSHTWRDVDGQCNGCNPCFAVSIRGSSLRFPALFCTLVGNNFVRIRFSFKKLYKSLMIVKLHYCKVINSTTSIYIYIVIYIVI